MGFKDFLLKAGKQFLGELLSSQEPLGESATNQQHSAKRKRSSRTNAQHKNLYDVDELAQRLEMSLDKLRVFQPSYHTFQISKKRGGKRTIDAPNAETKKLQRAILQKLLSKLRVHDAVTGFEKGMSIVDNARPHCYQAIVVRLDLVNFFNATAAARIEDYFRFIGWSQEAASLLTKLTTHKGHLPQGAPTSPRLSNLVNFLLDSRIAGLVKKYDGVYTRYADDITLSFSNNGTNIHIVQAIVRKICEETGYTVHRKKGGVRRRHQQQKVTGLVVNERFALPRATRRRLRAALHRARLADPLRPSTLSEEELLGWLSLMKMIERG